MAILNRAEISSLIEAMLEGMPIQPNRANLIRGIDFRVISVILYGPTDRTQLDNDLSFLNDIERIGSGEIPLETYLNNALPFLFGRKQEGTVKSFLDTINQRASGSPKIDMNDLPEVQERIIHSDDMVTHRFMELGLQAGLSVMRLRVKSYEGLQPRKLDNGNDMYFSGTGWLLGKELMITNHHVINARKNGETDASEDDLKFQAEHTEVIYDDNWENAEPGKTINGMALLAYNKELDYAVVRIPATGRQPLTALTVPVVVSTASVPLNIIQHPRGKSKKYAIRNNLLSGGNDRDLRYFTDTDGGTSGSPVFNDSWQVVALHKSSLSVSQVQFQGKTTAYVNAGTRITLILRDLRDRFPELADEAGY